MNFLAKEHHFARFSFQCNRDELLSEGKLQKSSIIILLFLLIYYLNFSHSGCKDYIAVLFHVSRNSELLVNLLQVLRMCVNSRVIPVLLTNETVIWIWYDIR